MAYMFVAHACITVVCIRSSSPGPQDRAGDRDLGGCIICEVPVILSHKERGNVPTCIRGFVPSTDGFCFPGGGAAPRRGILRF